jgi:hypothetical protein
MTYSEDQLRDFAMRVAWQVMDDEAQQQMLSMARASLEVAKTMDVLWQMPDIVDVNND